MAIKKSALNKMNKAVSTLQALSAFLEGEASNLRDSFDAKSEKWQASDAGQWVASDAQELEDIKDGVVSLTDDLYSFLSDHGAV